LRYEEIHERHAPSDESGGAFDDLFDDHFSRTPPLAVHADLTRLGSRVGAQKN